MATICPMEEDQLGHVDDPMPHAGHYLTEEEIRAIYASSWEVRRIDENITSRSTFDPDRTLARRLRPIH